MYVELDLIEEELASVVEKLDSAVTDVVDSTPLLEIADGEE